jgi:hypothetical protein
MKVSYTYLGKVDAWRCRRYEPGDRLVSHTRTAEVAPGEAAIAVANRLYDLHSGEDHPDAWSYPPIGLGDVLVIGGFAIAVTGTGLEPTEFDPADVISEADWLEFIAPYLARRVRGFPQPRDCRRNLRTR